MENLLKACSFLSSGPSEIAGPDVAAWNELWRDDSLNRRGNLCPFFGFASLTLKGASSCAGEC